MGNHTLNGRLDDVGSHEVACLLLGCALLWLHLLTLTTLHSGGLGADGTALRKIALNIATSEAFAVVGAGDLGLVAFAVVLEAATPLAVASLIVLPPDGILLIKLPNFRPKGIWIAIQAQPDGLLSILLMFQAIVALLAIAPLAEFPIGKAFAVELEALGSGAVARTLLTIRIESTTLQQLLNVNLLLGVHLAFRDDGFIGEISNCGHGGIGSGTVGTLAGEHMHRETLGVARDARIENCRLWKHHFELILVQNNLRHGHGDATLLTRSRTGATFGLQSVLGGIGLCGRCGHIEALAVFALDHQLWRRNCARRWC